MISKILNLILILLFLYGCNPERMAAKTVIEQSVSTGITKDPKPRSASKKKFENYTINDDEIKIININKLTENKINYYNNKKVENLDHKIKKYSDIYDYKYEYVLGASDVVNIN